MSNLPATADKRQALVAEINSEAGLKQLAAALPQHIDAKRFARLTLSAINRNPKLAECSKSSFFYSMMRCAEFGLLPDGRQGALVPFKGEVQFIPMYQGLIDCACRSGKVKAIVPHCVYEKDHFRYSEGLDPRLEHVPNIRENPGKLIGVYAVAHMSDGYKVGRFMPLWRVEEHRMRSPAVKNKMSSPWDTDYDAMAMKTVVRELCKFIPQSAELSEVLTADAEQYDNEPVGKAATFDIPAQPSGDEPTRSLPLRKPDQPAPSMQTEETVDPETGEVVPPPAAASASAPAPAPAPAPANANGGTVLCPGPGKRVGKQIKTAVCDELCEHVLGCAARKAAG